MVNSEDVRSACPDVNEILDTLAVWVATVLVVTFTAPKLATTEGKSHRDGGTALNSLVRAPDDPSAIELGGSATMSETAGFACEVMFVGGGPRSAGCATRAGSPGVCASEMRGSWNYSLSRSDMGETKMSDPLGISLYSLTSEKSDFATESSTWEYATVT